MATAMNHPKGRPVPQHLAVAFAIRPQLEYRLSVVMNAVRELLAMARKPGAEAVDWQEVLELYRDAQDFVLSHIPNIPCECIEAIKCDLCQGKEWLTLADLERIRVTLPPRSSGKSRGVRPTPEQRRRLRGRLSAADRKQDASSVKTLRLASKRATARLKHLQKRLSEASSASAGQSAAASGPLETENEKQTSGS
jgi:hypothetical protein